MNIVLPYKDKNEVREKMSDLGLGVREFARIVGANEREIRAVLSPISEQKSKEFNYLTLTSC